MIRANPLHQTPQTQRRRHWPNDPASAGNPQPDSSKPQHPHPAGRLCAIESHSLDSGTQPFIPTYTRTIQDALE